MNPEFQSDVLVLASKEKAYVQALQGVDGNKTIVDLVRFLLPSSIPHRNTTESVGNRQPVDAIVNHFTRCPHN
jgi:hypothetical protein